MLTLGHEGCDEVPKTGSAQPSINAWQTGRSLKEHQTD
jgi:hypothetical protein